MKRLACSCSLKHFFPKFEKLFHQMLTHYARLVAFCCSPAVQFPRVSSHDRLFGYEYDTQFLENKISGSLTLLDSKYLLTNVTRA